MQLNLNKALFLSYLLTVALSCKTAPREINATANSTSMRWHWPLSRVPHWLSASGVGGNGGSGHVGR
ncbi:hypothetical protein ACJRO7_035550 [Eucalyptus globulus]|uniref:Uncharacterized protein n=1 Tax=Eucalyptus globulus TaxID=34317 RepID=A0ABD3JBF3_EUCGL